MENFCQTYQPDVFVIVYSVIDRKSFKTAEDMLKTLWDSKYIGEKAVILVANKADLERRRQVTHSGKFGTVTCAWQRKAKAVILMANKDDFERKRQVTHSGEFGTVTSTSQRREKAVILMANKDDLVRKRQMTYSGKFGTVTSTSQRRQ